MLFAHFILNYENSLLKLIEVDQNNLRQGIKIKNIFLFTKYEHLAFRFFFRQFILKICNVDFTVESQSFKVQISLVSSGFKKKSTWYFPRFVFLLLKRLLRDLSFRQKNILNARFDLVLLGHIICLPPSLVYRSF